MAGVDPRDRLERRRLADPRPLLRPYEDGEVVDLTTDLYRRLLGELWPKMLGPSLLIFASVVFLFTFIFPSLFSSNAGATEVQQTWEVLLAIFLGVLVCTPMAVGGMATATYHCVKAATRVIMGTTDEEPGHAGLTAFVRAYLAHLHLIILPPTISLLAFFGASRVGEGTSQEDALAVFLTSVGAFALAATVLVLLVFLGRTLLLGPVMILEGTRGKEALRRSGYLISNRPFSPNVVGPMVGVLFACLLILIVLGAGFQFLISMALMAATGIEGQLGPGVAFFYQVVSALPYLGGIMLVLPLWGIVSTVVYFDRRVRYELLDVRMMAEDLRAGARRTRLLR